MTVRAPPDERHPSLRGTECLSHQLMPRFCRYSCSYSLVLAIIRRFGDARSELTSGGVAIKHEEWTRIPLLSELRDKLETEFHTTFNAVHCSYFRNGTHWPLLSATHVGRLFISRPPSFRRIRVFWGLSR
jgi:hypothetical protein